MFAPIRDLFRKGLGAIALGGPAGRYPDFARTGGCNCSPAGSLLPHVRPGDPPTEPVWSSEPRGSVASPWIHRAFTACPPGTSSVATRSVANTSGSPEAASRFARAAVAPGLGIVECSLCLVPFELINPIRQRRAGGFHPIATTHVNGAAIHDGGLR